MLFVSAKKKKKSRRLVFYLLGDPAAPENHLVQVHLEHPWLRQDLNVQVGLQARASLVLPEDPAYPCLQPTQDVNNISRTRLRMEQAYTSGYNM